MQTKIIKVNQLNFNVFDQGSGEPILLLHGFPDSLQVWRKLIPRLLGAGYRVIAYDQRGFGQTDAPLGVTNYRSRQIVSDLVGILQALQVTQKVKLIAHDWGANIGWRAILTQPELFSSYVTLGVGHPRAFAQAGGFEQLRKSWYALSFLFTGSAERLFSCHDWALFRKFTKYNPEATAHWLPDLQRPGRFTAALNWYRANLNPYYWEKHPAVQNATVSLPVLGIIGEQDPYLSYAQMQHSVYYAPNLTIIAVIGAGHWLQLENTELVFQKIRTYYQQLVTTF
ncbi:alpha/beta fold hydrolase [Loigolactobacillus zhaoyuanensis]|uniref:alpha/beta fold hydrolase n=1 Tax=Loigolactobacillus zhaoyuanensis TaxID=2486017 RepID=UPI000F744C4C|nr:alpha/beta fold hydrolase [Loigolactobacillus zhaoyuanensis]